MGVLLEGTAVGSLIRGVLIRGTVSSLQLCLFSVELNQLTALESLNVASNELTSLPPSIGKMANLKCLNITSNKITVLPDG